MNRPRRSNRFDSFAEPVRPPRSNRFDSFAEPVRPPRSNRFDSFVESVRPRRSNRFDSFAEPVRPPRSNRFDSFVESVRPPRSHRFQIPNTCSGWRTGFYRSIDTSDSKSSINQCVVKNPRVGTGIATSVAQGEEFHGHRASWDPSPDIRRGQDDTKKEGIMKTTGKVRNVVMLVLVVLLLAACGGGGSEELEASIGQSELAVTRRLVVNLEDASILLEPGYLNSLKDTEGDAEAEGDIVGSVPTSTNEEIDIVFLQKWTTDDEIKPALYVVKETSLSIPVDVPELSENAEEDESETDDVEGDESVPENAEEDEVSASRSRSRIVLDDLIGNLHQVRTTTSKQIYLKFQPPVEYNDGKSCALFVATYDSDIACVDSSAEKIEIIGADRDGNFYYLVYEEADTIIRRRAADDGTVTDLAGYKQWSIKDINGFYNYDSIKLFPDGSIVVTRDFSGAYEKLIFKKIGMDGISEITFLEEAENIDEYFISADGRLVFYHEKYDCKTGYIRELYIVPFEKDAVPTRLIDLVSIGMHQLYYFFQDEDGNLWARGNSYYDKIYKDILLYIDVQTPSGSIFRDIESDIIRNDFYDYGTRYIIETAEDEEKTDRFFRLAFNGSLVEKEEIIGVPRIMENYAVRVGRDGRIFVMLEANSHEYIDRLGYIDEDGVFTVTPLFAGGSGIIYPLWPEGEE